MSEQGVDAGLTGHCAVAYAVARLTSALVWIYHGLVPKWLFPTTGELNMLHGSGMFPGSELLAVRAMGAAEIFFGLLLLVFWRAGWLLLVQVFLLAGLTVAAAVSAPASFAAPFNPLTLNLSLAALGYVGFVSSGRKPPPARL